MLPDVPTVAEAAIPGFDVESWHGMLAPAKVPREVVLRLNRDIVSILGQPEVRKLLLSEGGDITPTTPEEFAAFLRTEVTKWARVIKQANITLE
jgi:tripartite-type tricarboxylate transporter receptor subunit TctC